ncbi:PTS lactose/cellobiose transporter subunit IIA [Vagococcus sp.]|uniref:PTS lactose/cellobiose transporter subunit IIA n=1 Tax=Vagococcus sp. TaxID=1933889 RepID=UPI003F96F00E
MSQIQLEAVMNLIVRAGNAKSEAVEAIALAKAGDFVGAEEKIKLANESLVEAHHAQTSLLTAEANGDDIVMSLLTVHSQDHLMTGMTFKDLAKEIIELYQYIDKK